MFKSARQVYHKMGAFHNKKLVLDYDPLISSIELTDRCNLSCWYCARDEVREHRGFGDMPWNQYMSILERYPELIRDIRLYLSGEPTLYPRFIDACQAAKDVGAKSIGITTNGVFKLDLREMFEAGLTSIEFSFDGISKSMYDSHRRGGDYHLVIENIREAAQLANTEFPNVSVRINTVETQYTRPKLEEFVEYWESIPGILCVDVGRIHDWHGKLDTYEDFGLEREKQPFSCYSPWYHVFIYWEGSVVPCCIWLDTPMGNIFKEDLREIWNNQKFICLRSKLLKGRKHHNHCAECWTLAFSVPYFQITEINRWYPMDRYLFQLYWYTARRKLGFPKTIKLRNV